METAERISSSAGYSIGRGFNPQTLWEPELAATTLTRPLGDATDSLHRAERQTANSWSGNHRQEIKKRTERAGSRIVFEFQ